MSTIRVDNFGPSAGGTTYSARGIAKAWVNFDGTGTIAARDSENVSSLTDNATGDYTVNWSSAMANVNYCVASSTSQSERPLRTGTASNTYSGITASAARVQQHYGTSGVALGEDVAFVGISIHGDLA